MAAGLKKQLQSILTKGPLNATASFISPVCTVVRYHSVRPPRRWSECIPDSISHSPELFEEQIRWLAKHYQIINLGELSDRLQRSRALERRLAVLTFDDGFLDNYEYAAPILESHGVRGAFFVTVEPISNGLAPWFSRTYRAFNQTAASSWESSDGHRFNLGDSTQRTAARHWVNRSCAAKPFDLQLAELEKVERGLDVDPESGERLMMNWQEVTELQQRGHTIGSHTLSHPNLTLLDDASLARELGESKSILESRLNTAIEHLSYPNPIIQPHWNRRIIESARTCGYLTAGTSTSGYVRFGADPLALLRVAAPNDSLTSFKWHLQYRPRHIEHQAEEES